MQVLLTIFTIYYVYFISRIRTGLFLLKSAPITNIQQTVSVVIAARNEELFIGQCLQSLVNQTYPSNKYEIIIVDDGSVDNTASIVMSFSERYAYLHLLSLPAESEHTTGRKPLAIAKGIDNAVGEIILTTDADCILPPRWIEIMANHFENDVAFVAGPVAEQISQNILSKLDQLEFLGLITTAAGLIGLGKPIICNGANLAYRKKIFFSIGGFGDYRSSNDDESLMNRIALRNVGRIVFAPEPEGVVVTRSSNTITSFLRQRVRWANKRGHYEDKSIFIKLISLYLFFLSFTLTVLLIPIESLLLLPVICAFIVKIIVDYFTLRSGARLFLQRIPIFYFIIAELLHVPYIVIAAAIGQISSLNWKGRKIKR